MSDNEASETNNANVDEGGIAEELDGGNIFKECQSVRANASDSDSESSIIKKHSTDDGKSKSDKKKTISDVRRFKISSVSAFYYYVMQQHWAEFCLSAGLLLTVLSSLFHAHYAMKGRLAQRKAPSPVRFFSRNSIVTDLYDGNGLDLHKILASQSQRHGSTGLVFVMYYAPWCARSMDAKWHMDNLARYFYPIAPDLDTANSSKSILSSHGPVHFVAVNCWDPNGFCRKSYKLYAYPVFLAYPGTMAGIYYNGIISADYMFRFLENIISPFVRLQSNNDLFEYLQDYKTAVIAFFDFQTSRRPDDYQHFYGATLKALERDPLRAATKFAIITQPDFASSLGFTRNGQIKLYRLMNETILDYPYGKQFSAKSISSWIFENLANPVRWVSPSAASAGKSDALHEFVTRKPTLIIFAPRQPLFYYSSDYMTLTEVALRYFDCPDSAPGTTTNRSIRLILEKLHAQEKESKIYRRRLNDFCLRTLREEVRLLNDCCDAISHSSADGQKSLNDYRQKNICHVCYPQDRQTVDHTDNLLLSASFCERFVTFDDFPNTMTMATKQFLTPLFSSRSCDRLVNDYLPRTSVIDYCCRQDEWDGAGAERFIKHYRKGHRSPKVWSASRKGRYHRSTTPNCEKLRLSRLLRYANDDRVAAADITKSAHLDSLVGLSCQTNRTIQFAAMDKNFYGAFARKLGIALKDSATAVIFDNSKEAVYVMDNATNIDQLGAFVIDFTYNRLSRFYRTQLENTTTWTSVSGETERHCASSGAICIRTVTSSTFQSVVMDQEKDVILLYTARWCGSCQRLFHVFQTLVYYFRVAENDIMFAQMDVTSNDLPWEYTIDDIPALIFFPAKSKSESVVFPNYAPWTLPNLVAFVLAHCRREIRLRFALSTCVRNSTDDAAAADSRCLIRNRYRAWRQLSRTERKIWSLTSEIHREVEFSKYDWDHEDDEEWRVYLQQSWKEVGRLELKRRALKTLLTDALSRSHFVERTGG